MDARTQMACSLQSAANALHNALEAAEDLQRAGVPADVAGIEAAMGAVEDAQRTARQRAEGGDSRLIERVRAAGAEVREAAQALL